LYNEAASQPAQQNLSLLGTEFQALPDLDANANGSLFKAHQAGERRQKQDCVWS
jgi:hypothetical protein